MINQIGNYCFQKLGSIIVLIEWPILKGLQNALLKGWLNNEHASADSTVYLLAQHIVFPSVPKNHQTTYMSVKHAWLTSPV